MNGNTNTNTNSNPKPRRSMAIPGLDGQNDSRDLPYDYEEVETTEPIFSPTDNSFANLHATDPSTRAVEPVPRRPTPPIKYFGEDRSFMRECMQRQNFWYPGPSNDKKAFQDHRETMMRELIKIWDRVLDYCKRKKGGSEQSYPFFRKFRVVIEGVEKEEGGRRRRVSLEEYVGVLSECLKEFGIAIQTDNLVHFGDVESSEEVGAMEDEGVEK